MKDLFVIIHCKQVHLHFALKKLPFLFEKICILPVFFFHRPASSVTMCINQTFAKNIRYNNRLQNESIVAALIYVGQRVARSRI